MMITRSEALIRAGLSYPYPVILWPSMDEERTAATKEYHSTYLLVRSNKRAIMSYTSIHHRIVQHHNPPPPATIHHTYEATTTIDTDTME
jgi:hypothetical protein